MPLYTHNTHYLLHRRLKQHLIESMLSFKISISHTRSDGSQATPYIFTFNVEIFSTVVRFLRSTHVFTISAICFDVVSSIETYCHRSAERVWNNFEVYVNRIQIRRVQSPRRTERDWWVNERAKFASIQAGERARGGVWQDFVVELRH